MRKQELNTNWKMRQVNQEDWLSAVVPGSVYSDLLDHNKMSDPYYRDQEMEALALMEEDYEYLCTFCPESELLACDQVILRLEGLDTLAKLCLNGILLGQTANMHRIWEYDIKEYLNTGENQLSILFQSPVRYIREENEVCFVDGAKESMAGFAHIRKAHCMFGWDWGPRLPDAGIFRPISLLGVEKARINSVYLRQKHTKDSVHIILEPEVIECEKYSKNELEYKVCITTPDKTVYHYADSPKEIQVNSPKLWWPNGYGEQPLYQIEVSLYDVKSGRCLDKWKKNIGLRTIGVRRIKDEYGESFAHEVNGVAVFAMGADYIPQDNLLRNVTKEGTKKLLSQCKSCNFNVIRVWGGGYYPEDFFFDICDELGLMVWQDFMFACSAYELTQSFEANITEEFIDNIKRIRHHVSLALWCGNNEMEMFMDGSAFLITPKQRADYIKMYEYLIPKILKELDPDTFYWPASPSSGGSFDEPNAPNRGDVHYWDVWHGGAPFTAFRDYYFRYLSEFGMQSFPCYETIASFTKPEDRNIFSYVMEKHQRNEEANGKIMNYLSKTYLYPTDFKVLLYASQLLQAEAIRYGVEHFRRNRGRCMGTVYWQLNDCWPVASWSSIDYFGRWKALQYYAKRFFAPLLLSCEEEGFLTQNYTVNAQNQKVNKSARFCVTNETRMDQEVTVIWSLRDRDSHKKREGRYDVLVPALTALWFDSIDFSDASVYEDYVYYELWQESSLISSGTVIFSVPKYFHFADPKLSIRVEGDELVITALAYAKGVEVRNIDETMILSDNYFDMNAGQKRVKILSGCVDGIQLRSIYDIR